MTNDLFCTEGLFKVMVIYTDLLCIQGSCTRDPCKFLHSAPIDCGVGNSKTTWKDVWKREEGRHREDGPDGKRRRMDDGRDFFTGMAPNNGSGGMGNYGMSAMGNGTTGMGGGGMMPNMAMANGTPEQQIWKLQVNYLKTV